MHDECQNFAPPKCPIIRVNHLFWCQLGWQDATRMVYSLMKKIDLVEKYGSPLYLYDFEKIQKNIENFLTAFPKNRYRIKYACKALTNPSVLSFMNQFPIGIDAVSIQEVQLALDAGFQAGNILYTPNCVQLNEIEKAIDLGVMINIDNLPQLEKLGQKYGDKIELSVRINPHILAGGHYKISTGHIDSKFGISIHQLDDLHRLVEKYQLNIIGLHMHTGSDILDAQVFITGAKVLFEIARSFFELKFIDLGSGFKVAYKEGDISTDINQLSHALNSELKNHPNLDKTEIWFEPGKALVSNAGYFLAEVTVVKPTPSCIFLGVNTGFHQLIRPMLYEAYHYIENLSRPDAPQKPYHVVGQICETDTFATNRMIAEAEVGDILCFHNAGAYSFSMSSQYNSRTRPAEVATYDGIDYLIRESETLIDLNRHATGVVINVKK